MFRLWLPLTQLILLFYISCAFNRIGSIPYRFFTQKMALDNFVVEKLNNICRNFDALTERLSDPDISSDRHQLLLLSKERATSEQIVTEYLRWQEIEKEKDDLLAVDMNASNDIELKEMVKEELQNFEEEQNRIEKQILIAMLPRDPNDDRNVMLEVRSGKITVYIVYLFIRLYIYIYRY